MTKKISEWYVSNFVLRKMYSKWHPALVYSLQNIIDIMDFLKDYEEIFILIHIRNPDSSSKFKIVYLKFGL